VVTIAYKLIPYLHRLIDKYRVPESFDAYMSEPKRNREKELEVIRITAITPDKTATKKYIMKE
jgi:hypothetical protein